MKIAVISDTHDKQTNLDKFLNWCKENKPNIIIHCGDVASFSTLQYLTNNFQGPIYLSLGNADLDPEQMKALQNSVSTLKVTEDFGEIEIKNLRIAFTHFPWKAKELAKENNYHFIFYGHTHKPWAKKLNETYLINPGNLKGEPYQPTFCVLDLEKKKFELVLLNKL